MSQKKIVRRDKNGAFKTIGRSSAGSALRVHKIQISEETRRSLTADVDRWALDRIEITEK